MTGIHRCSFCGKHQDDVLNLVAGPSAFICNECVDKSAKICEDYRIRCAVREALQKEGAVASIAAGKLPQ